MADKDDNKTEGTGGTDMQTLADRQDARDGATQDRVEASREVAAEDLAARTEPADIAPAKAADFEASGAVVEPAHLKAIDVDHPAVDNNPRAGTTARQNQIDFNDPTLSDRKAVEQRLDNQS